MSLNFLLVYSVTVFIASIIPGPSMLLALTHGIQHGAKKSLASALGNVSVTLVQATFSIAGLGTVLLASERIFHIIKWAGAAYLVYMGISILFSPGFLAVSHSSKTGHGGKSKRKMFLQAAVITAGNPKAIVFFTAIFPQFIDPGTTYLLQSAVLLTFGAVIAFVCFMIYAVFGQKIITWFLHGNVAKIVKNSIGTGFIASGVGLALAKP